MQTQTILIHGISEKFLSLVKEIAVQSNWSPYICDSVQEMKQWELTRSIHALLLDSTDTRKACEILREVHERVSRLSTIVVTGTPTVEEAVEVMKLGAVDYLSYDSLPSNLPALLEELRQTIRSSDRCTAATLEAFQESGGLIGSSPPFQRVLRKARTAAVEQENILISGESGTGKELLATAIHKSSRHADGPFLPINCGAIPRQLLESELFGHLKGAYTGAVSTEDGFFQAAQGGTLFLDEIGNTSPGMQAKLLRPKLSDLSL